MTTDRSPDEHRRVTSPVRLWSRLTEPHPSVVEPAERGRAQLLTAVLIGLIVLAAAYAVWFGAYDVSSNHIWSDSILLITAGGLVILLLTYWLSRGPHWRIAAVTLVVVSNLFMLVVILVAPQSSLDTAWLLVGLLACSLLLSPRVTVILLTSLCAVTFILPWLVVTPPWFGTGEAEVLLITVGLLIVAVAVVRRSDLRRLERQAHELIDREATLRDSEERYRVLAESSPDMIFVIDRDDRVRYANARAAATVGRSAEAAVGMARADLFAAEATGQMNDQMGAGLDDVFRSGQTRHSESELASPLGSLWITTWLVPIKDETGAVTAVLVTSRDITERMQAENEIRRLNAELEQRVVSRTAQFEAANRELEAFAYSVSHDLRAPLRAIDGFTQMVIEDAAERLAADDVEHLQRARAAAQRMASLIDGLLALSRSSRRDLVCREVDLSALAESVVEELREAQPERSVDVVVTPELRAWADAELTRLILVNLIGNAWKFTSRHESARIEVGADDFDGERTFYVRDDGAGFDMAHAEMLFGAFQRLHSPGEFEGDGVGLATVQRIVARHGGRVWAEAEIEKGATFYFTLPGRLRTR